MKRGAVCAEWPKNDRTLTVASLLFFGGMTLLALRLLATGDPVEKTLGALALALSLLLALCAGHQLLNPPPERYSLEDGTIRFGGESLALSAVRSARVERRPACPLLKHTLTELALVLEANTGERLALPLTHKGWERVYEALSTRRPELGLRPWHEDLLVLEELLRARGAVRPRKTSGSCVRTSTWACSRPSSSCSFSPSPSCSFPSPAGSWTTRFPSPPRSPSGSTTASSENGFGSKRTGAPGRSPRRPGQEDRYFPYFSSAFSTKALV